MRECFDKSSQCGIMGHEKKRPPKIKRKRKNPKIEKLRTTPKGLADCKF